MGVAGAESDRGEARSTGSHAEQSEPLFLLRRNVKDFVDATDAAREVRGEKQLYQLGSSPKSRQPRIDWLRGQ